MKNTLFQRPCVLQLRPLRKLGIPSVGLNKRAAAAPTAVPKLPPGASPATPVKDLLDQTLADLGADLAKPAQRRAGKKRPGEK